MSSPDCLRASINDGNSFFPYFFTPPSPISPLFILLCVIQFSRVLTIPPLNNIGAVYGRSLRTFAHYYFKMSVGVASGIYQHIKILPSILRTKKYALYATNLLCNEPIFLTKIIWIIKKQVKSIKIWRDSFHII